MTTKMKKIIEFEKKGSTKKKYEDAECSECRNGFEDTKYWYHFGGKNWGGLQLCDSCFEEE